MAYTWQTYGIASGRIVSVVVLGPTGKAIGLYYNRNRFYHPHLGRFLTRDPNETALPIIAVIAMNGEAASVLMSSFDGQALYADGMNLYRREGANLVNGGDPLGLDDFQDDIDQALGRALGDRISAMGIVERALREGEEGKRKADLYAALSFGWGDFIWDINEQILFDLIVGPFFASACFEAGTGVLMVDGLLKPIEEAQVGDWVTTPPSSVAAQPKASPFDPDSYAEIDAAVWRKIALRLDDAEHGVIRITLLRNYLKTPFSSDEHP